MTEFVQFALLGLGVGALYAFAAQGLVLVYRGSGVLNFAHGAIGVAGAYVQWELRAQQHWAYATSFLAGVVFAAAIGALFHLLAMRRLRHSSPLVRVVATLGLLILLQGIATNRYGASIEPVPSALPQSIWHVTQSITITSDRVYLIVISLTLAIALWLVYRFTIFGLATAATAENQRSAAALGWSRDFIAATNWALGSALAAAAAILIAPIATLSVATMTALLLATLAAALVGNFRSFPLTLLGGLAIGVIETELGYYASRWGSRGVGLPSSVPFFVIVALLLIRGRALPLRDFFLQRMPAVGSGRLRLPLVAAFTAAGIAVITLLPAVWAGAATTTLSVATMMLSIVVLTGYAGQISLAQFALAGSGAWIAARLVAGAGWPFGAGAALGVAGAVPLGLIFALPALRTRGINLAIATLGLGSAIEFMVFDNLDYTGGYSGSVIGSPHIFGWNIDAISHPQRYASVCLLAFVACAVLTGNLRRGRSGRRLLAVRTNERAATALGISVFEAKLYAFSVAAAVAAVGGIFALARTTSIVFTNLSNMQSIILVALTVIGGAGYLLGPLFGAMLAAGGLGSQITDSLFGGSVSSWLQVFSGGVLILLVLQAPDGLAKLQTEQLHRLRQRIDSRLRGRGGTAPVRVGGVMQASTRSEARRERVSPRRLEAADLTVAYGAVTACDAVSLTVNPGEVVGLIGPNGAGKTSLIDAITGFTTPTAGTVILDGVDITRWSPLRRARAGISRSFQSLELFEDMTVLDNLRAASEPRDACAYFSDLIYPKVAPLEETAVAAIADFGLAEILDRKVDGLAYGQRRLLATARAVASRPSILLVDECAAGLAEHETAELASLVRQLAEAWGLGILLIEHDVNFVMGVCDQINVLDFGRKIAAGPPALIREDENVIAAYLGRPDAEAAGAHPLGAAVGLPR